MLKRLILKESLSFLAFRHICILLSCMHEKEGVEWKHQFDKKKCVQKHQFEITCLWQFKRLLRYNRPIRSTFKSSQNTAPRQFNFMCLDVVKWTAHLGKVEKGENKFHDVYLFDNWGFWMITFISKMRGVKKSFEKLNVQGYFMFVTESLLCQLCDGSKPRSAVRQCCHRLSICFSYLIWQIVK